MPLVGDARHRHTGIQTPSQNTWEQFNLIYIPPRSLLKLLPHRNRIERQGILAILTAVNWLGRVWYLDKTQSNSWQTLHSPCQIIWTFILKVPGLYSASRLLTLKAELFKTQVLKDRGLSDLVIFHLVEEWKTFLP